MSVCQRRRRLEDLQEDRAKWFCKEEKDQDGFEIRILSEKGNP
jgi:hypothetical protein